VRTRRVAIVVLAVLAVMLLVWAIHGPVLRGLASTLTIEDPLTEADAIVVVGGGAPFRELVAGLDGYSLRQVAAADLYRQGWAPRVVLSRPTNPAGVEALVALGVRSLDLQAESRAAVLRYGVPATAVVTLEDPVSITEEELGVLQREARARKWRRLILVTSPEHTRRVKTIWYRRGNGDMEVIVRPSPYSSGPADGWWRDRRLTERVLHEYLGLAAVYLGVSGWMR
jgi:uncharacterized SAM-binding protein YcdF (DUF218 family)